MNKFLWGALEVVLALVVGLIFISLVHLLMIVVFKYIAPLLIIVLPVGISLFIGLIIIDIIKDLWKKKKD